MNRFILTDNSYLTQWATINKISSFQTVLYIIQGLVTVIYVSQTDVNNA